MTADSFVFKALAWTVYVKSFNMLNQVEFRARLSLTVASAQISNVLEEEI